MQVVYYGMIIIIIQPLGSFAPLAAQPGVNAKFMNGVMLFGPIEFLCEKQISQTLRHLASS